jgi:hypothetical protein
MEMAHLFFGNAGGISLSNLLATHPPLSERIRAIDPTWDGTYTPVTRQVDAQVDRHVPGIVSGFAASSARVAIDPASVIDAAGTVPPQRLAFAEGLRAAIPMSLVELSADAFGARAMVLALLLDANPEIQQRQLQVIRLNLDSATELAALHAVGAIGSLGDGAKLPLVDVALPALRRLSSRQAEEFLAVVQRLIEVDRRVTLLEYAIKRVIERQLSPPNAQSDAAPRFLTIASMRNELMFVLSAFAQLSASDPEAAFQRGARVVDPNRPGQMLRVEGLGTVDAAFKRLAMAGPVVKQKIIEAAVQTISADGQVSPAEFELLRATAAALDVPIPPMFN